MDRGCAVEGIHDMTTMRRLAIAAALLGSLWAGTALANVQFWGDKVSQPAETQAAALTGTVEHEPPED
jgi:P pilus assembly chaperone PapD